MLRFLDLSLSKFRDSLDNLYQLISDFFSKSDPSLFILYYSGPADDRGNWPIANRVVYGEEYEDLITLDSIVTKWKTAKSSSNCYLLIILDAPNSEKWVNKVENHEAEANIIILASSTSGGGNTSGTQSLGQYTHSLIGSQRQGFYPRGAQELIRKYLTGSHTATNGLVCYVDGIFVCYK